MQVREVMTRGVECARPGDTIAAAAQRMKDLDVGALPVCGDNDRLVGMVSLGDLAVKGGDERLSGETLEVVSEPAGSSR